MTEKKHVGPDMRKYLRLETFFEVWYSAVAKPADKVKAYCADMTREGCKLVSQGSLPVGSYIELKMVVPTSDDPVFALGQVVRAAKQGDGAHCLGVKILAIQPQDRYKLLNYVYDEWLKMKRKEHSSAPKGPHKA